MSQPSEFVVPIGELLIILILFYFFGGRSVPVIGCGTGHPYSITWLRDSGFFVDDVSSLSWFVSFVIANRILYRSLAGMELSFQRYVVHVSSDCFSLIFIHHRTHRLIDDTLDVFEW